MDQQKTNLVNKMKIEYTIKLWLLTIFLGPFIGGAYEILNNTSGQVVGLLEVFPITLLFSFVLSIPTLIVVVVAAKLIKNSEISLRLKKLIILVLTILGIVVTLLLLGGSLIPTLMFSYSVAALLSTLILEIPLPDRVKIK